MLSILLDPNRLGTSEVFGFESEAFIEWLMQSPPASDVDRIKLAGDPEREHRRKRSAEGIAIDSTTWEEILAAGEKLGLTRSEVQELAGI
jgi:hydroxycarboxylate dehydrogenase B